MNGWKKGYTLIEVIIAVAILAILTGLVTVGVYGYLSSAYTTRVNETAKTVFYAAQNYLLEQKQMGQLKVFSDEAERYGGKLGWDELKEILRANLGSEFQEEEYKNKYATDSTGFIFMNKGSDASNPMYRIVQEATQDEKLLANTFLMEYDQKTGVVRAVFYSEQTNGFTYQGSHTDKANVILRSGEMLKQKRQGYYGVDITGKRPVSQVYIAEPEDVLLVNGERLYLQWTDTNDSNPEFMGRPELLDSLMYDVTISKLSEDQTTYIPMVSISDVLIENKLGTTTLHQADDSLLAGAGYRLAYDSTTRTYQLILDDIHHSLFETYTMEDAKPANVEVFENIAAEDILVCEIIAKLDKVETGLEAESLSAESNYQSSAFEGGAKTVTTTKGIIDVYGSGILENGTAAKSFGITVPRHLNNLRFSENKKENAYFEQRAQIDWKKAEGRALSKVFQTIKYTDPFQGSLEVKKAAGGSYYSISNITIQQPDTSFAGMFWQNMGTITGLTLIDPAVTGELYAGCVAGVNAGTLTDITITGGQVSGSHLLGGITGYQTVIGKMKNVRSDANVLGTTALKTAKTVPDVATFAAASKGGYIGGIAGLNKGALDTATVGKKNVSKITGTMYVGGAIGSNDIAPNITVKQVINYHNIELAANAAAGEALENIGGITGYQGEGTMQNCTNYGISNLKLAAGRGQDTLLHVGGIAGQNAGLIEACKNAGTAARLTTVQNDCVAAVQRGSLPTYAGKYVGGIVGTNLSTGELKKVENENAVITGYCVVGGIAGKNMGKVTASTSAVEKAGIVIATDYLAGGVFGYDSSALVSDYTNGLHVFGKGMVGGIMGFHGMLGETGDEQILSYLSGLMFDDSPEYYNKLLSIGTILKPTGNGIIKGCTNQGFVYAKDCFVGGIAGVNYGTISSSNARKENGFTFPLLHNKGTADCAGGIAGFNGNTGKIDGQRLLLKQAADVEVVAGDFAGGITGLNEGTISGYTYVEGGVFASGNCVGGVIGLNANPSAIAQMTVSRLDSITGAYFVGGILGCNVAQETGGDTVFQEVHTEKAAITATAYAGGILGYNSYISQGKSLGMLFAANGELTVLKNNAFTKLPDEVSEISAVKTVFQRCSSKASVKADRYVGGIVGFNSQKARLWIASCNNAGLLEIADASKTSPVMENGEATYYYFIGGITGWNSKTGIIHNSINDGTVKSVSTYLGGICEVNEGYVQFCATGTTSGSGSIGTDVMAKNSVGGITGLNISGARVVSCRADRYAKLNGGDKTGGLVGTNASGGIVTSNITGNEAADVSAIYEIPIVGEAAMGYCSGTIVGADHTGGIVGYNQGMVEKIQVRKEAVITGGTNVGGFVGYNAEGAVLGNEEQIIADLINYATVYGDHEVGGIVGKHEGVKIMRCTNAGKVEAIGDEYGYAGGITGSVVRKMTVEECINYGIVISRLSFAGGIAGINNGDLKNNNNFGSVEGSDVIKGVVITGETATGSAIGGITGANLPSGQVLDCASKTRWDDEDPLASEKNPYWSDSEPNQIKGAFMVGGIIGYYARNQYHSSKFLNETPFSKEVSIGITASQVNLDKGTRCNIGGVIGSYTYNPDPDVLEGYIYSGTIQVSTAAGNNQQNIGGILGYQHQNITLRNCYLKGKILGEGNNSDGGNYAGIGGLAGTSNGKIVVFPTIKNGETVYSSTLDNAKVEGAKRVGGVVGEVNSDHNIYLFVNNVEIPLEKVNQAVSSPDDYIYYENYATVQGGKSVGGFYGATTSNCKDLKYLRNHGNILSKDINDRSNMGGIIGATSVNMSYCQNNGSIGGTGDGNITTNVGGLVGNLSGTKNSRAILSHCINKGNIYAGKAAVGGLIGIGENVEISSDCKNEADIFVNSSGINTVSEVGGILGKVTGDSIILSTGNVTALNAADKTIMLKGRATAVGGIAGALNGTLSMNSIQNLSSITEAGNVAANNGKEVNAGGLLGTARGVLRLENCSNAGSITLTASDSVGGLLGISDAAALSVVNCENAAAIHGRGQTGGVIGYVKQGTVQSFTSNKNSARIQGRTSIGGIIGFVSNVDGIFSACVNTGTIKAVRDKTGNGAINGIGGFAGRAEGNAKLGFKELKNEGTIEVNKDNGIASVAEIGGIIGAMGGNGVSINSSLNKAAINVSLDSNASGNAIGGISGSARNASFIGNLDTKNQRTTNEGTITVIGGAVDKVYEIGGITGVVQINSKLEHCLNEGSVFASKDTGIDVGGIAGKSYGLIYSCRTESSVQVTGKTNVGGILGRAYDYTSKVTSGGTGEGTGNVDGYDLSYSAADVTGKERIGGIVGYQQEATIYNVFVTADASITLEATGEAKNAAGGLVGYAGPIDGGVTTKGVVASCYSFAEVRGTNAAAKQPYLGGIIGYREHKGREGAASITDCFVIDPTKIDPTMPPEPTGAVAAEPWAVGNEPLVRNTATGEESIFCDDRDTQVAPAGAEPLKSKDKFKWTQAGYDALCKLLNIGDADKKSYNSKEAIEQVMQKYDGYQLPAPEMNPIRAENGFIYTFPFKPLAGFYEKYGIKLYLGDYELEKEVPNGATLVQEFEKNTQIGEKIESPTEDLIQLGNIEEYVGQTLSVVTYVEGYTLNEADGLHYTKRSKEIVKQKFVIMPPLVMPKVKALEAKTTDTDFFDAQGKQIKVKLEIENWAEYKQSAASVYTKLNGIDTVKLADPYLYDKFLNGLAQFEMADGFNTKNTTGMENNFKVSHTIMEKSKLPAGSKEPYYEVVTEGGAEKAYITIDYSGMTMYQNNYATRPWHAFTIQAVTFSNHLNIPLNPKHGNFKYRYVNSYIYTGQSYRLKSKFFPPKDLKTTYTGKCDPDTEAATPGYELSWVKNGGVDSEIKGYQVELLKLVKTEEGAETVIDLTALPVYSQPPYIQTVQGAANTKLQLTKEQINQILTDCGIDLTVPWWEHTADYKLVWRVKTLTADNTLNVDSDVSASTEFTLIKRQQQITKIEAAKDVTKLSVTWQDDAYNNTDPAKNVYEVTYEINANGTSYGVVKKTVTGGCKWEDINVPTQLQDSPFTVTMTVRRMGEQGITLNSLVQRTEQFIGKRLETPHALNVTADKIAENEIGDSTLYLKMSWEYTGKTGENEEVTADNCTGYEIQVIATKNGNTEPETPIIFDIAGFDTTDTELAIPSADIKELKFVIKAVGVPSKVGDSNPAEMTKIVATNQLNSPELTKVTMNGSEIISQQTPPVVFMREEYESGLGAKITVDVSDSAASGQGMLFKYGEVTLWSGDESKTTGTYEVMLPQTVTDQLKGSMAGEEVTMYMFNRSGDIGIILPSAVSGKSFFMPRMHLNTPNIKGLGAKEITVSTNTCTVYDADIYLYEGLGDTTIQQEEAANRNGIIYEILDKAGNAVEFIPLQSDKIPANDGSFVTSWEIPENEISNGTAKPLFRLKNEISKEARVDYKLSVKSQAKQDAGNTKYAESKESTAGLDIAVERLNKTVSANQISKKPVKEEKTVSENKAQPEESVVSGNKVT